jgi:hypothetical protein
MQVVEENVSSATWLPRIADFEGYTNLLDDESHSGVEEGAHETVETSTETVMGGGRISGNNVSEQSILTPVLHHKTPTADGRRKSARKSRSLAHAETAIESPGASTPTYKPRKSKYDVC